jgi:molecular chaperone HtpG
MDKEPMPTASDEENAEETEVAAIEEEVVNSASALWAKSKQEIDDEAYNEFYKHMGHDFQDPLTHIHSRVEGTNEYTLLLYVPARAPFDLWDKDSKQGVKLYVRKVFIMDDADKLMPRYLRFIKGVIDSDSLPLNVSREILQQSRQLDVIRSGAVKKVLGLLEGLAKNDSEKYATFWEQFGTVIKEGPIEDFKNKDRIAKLLRFATTQSEGEKQTVGLEGYVSRMKEGQDKIYFVTADSYGAAKNSPHLEIFNKKGIEVLLLSDRVDEWLISHLTEFEGKTLQSVAKGGLDLGQLDDEDDKKEQDAVNKDFESVIKQTKEILGDKVTEVRLSQRLTDSPSCLVTEDSAMSLNMERIMKEAGQSFGDSKPIFELNPTHPLVLTMKDEQDDDRFSDLTNILFDQAILSEGGQLTNPADYVHRLNGLLQGLLK